MKRGSIFYRNKGFVQNGTLTFKIKYKPFRIFKTRAKFVFIASLNSQHDKWERA